MDLSHEMALTWREAELLAAEHMRALGFDDAEATPLGSDKGLDVVSSGGAAQVKHFATSPVGSPDLQRLKGAAHRHRRALFYSRSGYTTAAITYANAVGIALFTYDDTSIVLARNPVGEKLAADRHVPRRFGQSTPPRSRFLSDLTGYAQLTVDAVGRMCDDLRVQINDPIWRGQLNDAELAAVTVPAEPEIKRVMALMDIVQQELPAGDLVTAIVELEGLAQHLAARFGKEYGSYLRRKTT